MYERNEGKKDLVCNVHLELRRFETQRGGMVLQVESWNVGPRHLALRETYRTAEGEVKFGKAKGLAMEDLRLIRERYDEIEKAMGGRS